MRGTVAYHGTDRNGAHVWRLRVFTGNVEGKPRQVNRMFRWRPPSDRYATTGEKGEPVKGREEAQLAMASFILEYRADAVDRTGHTIATLADEWMRHQTHLSPTTLRDYRNVIDQVIKPELGAVKLAVLGSHQLDSFYQRQLLRVSGTTVRKYHAILSAMLRQAERWGWIIQSPTRSVRAPKANKPKLARPTIAEAAAIMRKADPHLRILLLMAAKLGPRRGELVGLRWSDVDLEHGRVLISRSIYEKEGGGLGTKDTKGHEEHTIAIDKHLLKALKAERVRQQERDLAAGRRADDPYVFSDDGFHPWRPDAVTKGFAKARARVKGAENVRLHDMRHLSASMLIAAGVDIVTVSKRLGHAKVSTTLDMYSYALEERDRAAAEVTETWRLGG